MCIGGRSRAFRRFQLEIVDCVMKLAKILAPHKDKNVLFITLDDDEDNLNKFKLNAYYTFLFTHTKYRNLSGILLSNLSAVTS